MRIYTLGESGLLYPSPGFLVLWVYTLTFCHEYIHTFFGSIMRIPHLVSRWAVHITPNALLIILCSLFYFINGNATPAVCCHWYITLDQLFNWNYHTLSFLSWDHFMGKIRFSWLDAIEVSHPWNPSENVTHCKISYCFHTPFKINYSGHTHYIFYHLSITLTTHSMTLNSHTTLFVAVI